MINALTDKLVYPAPTPSYTAKDMEGVLCWLPWNDAIPLPPTTTGTSSSSASTGCSSRCADMEYGTARSLPCLWIPSKRSANVIFYFHANAEDLGIVHSALVHLQRQLQVSVLAIEYPGYGLLKDQVASDEGICAAALVALRYIVSEVGIPYNQIMLLGRSLGSGPACYLASRFPVGGLLLVNPFLSLRRAAEFHMGKVLSNMAFKDSFKNEDLIGNVSCAVLFIHAAKDRTVPMEHSAQLFKRCRSRKLLVTPERMEHNSHLFADPQYLAVPAIHFFQFPGYQTDKPPTLPPQVFKVPLYHSSTPSPRGLHAWSCSGRMCASGNSEDEVAVPASASQSGHVDIADKVRATDGSASKKHFNPCPAGQIIGPAPNPVIDTDGRRPAGDEEASFPHPPLSARSRYPSPRNKSATLEQVGPGDESAGWPSTASGDKEKLKPVLTGSVSLDKIASYYPQQSSV